MSQITILVSKASAWIERCFPRLDLVGPVVALHVLVLTLVGVVDSPVPALVGAGVLLAWRLGMQTVAEQARHDRRGRLFFARALVSLVIVGAIVVVDGGTESPLFFSMLIVVVWEAVMSSLGRLWWLALTSIMVYVGTVLVAQDLTATSVARMVVFVMFVGILSWARVQSARWEEELDRTRQLVAGFAEDAPIGFAVYEPDSLRCLFANRMARRFRLESPSRVTLARQGGSGDSQFLRHLQAVSASGLRQGPSIYTTTGPGPTMSLRIGAKAFGDDRPLLLVYAEDVTAHATAGELQRKFLQSANHQFRTPLSPIVGYGEMIRSGELTGEEMVDAGEAIVDGARSIERLLDRIGAMLRVRAGNPTSAAVTVGELLQMFPRQKGSRVQIHVMFDGDPDAVVRCDPAPLSAALSELIDNSRRHGVPPVTVDVCHSEREVMIRVSDRGIGPAIEPDRSLDHTWDLLENPEVMPENMGDRLGITFAYALAEAAGGHLRFERDDGRWAFVLTFPAEAGLDRRSGSAQRRGSASTTRR
ncbi:MAG TPA: HAMP domain-containing sensor histidine kinase [Acidimicrobiia bacterium]|nr:HAMP domain-containing sensor histidine kinase [Acidimicrobiia bacterium]